MNLRYLSGALISIPLLPLMYFQGKQIRASIPDLPEATGSEGTSHDERSKNNLHITFVGESTIAGVGVQTHEEGLPGSFSREISKLFRTNVHWKVYAESGYTAKAVRKKLVPAMNEPIADLVVVGLGGNDAFTLNRPSKWKAEIRALIRAIREKYPEVVIVFCNMPPIKEFPAFTPLIKFTLGNLVEILGEELHKTVRKHPNVFYFGEQITLEKWNHKFDLKAEKKDFFSDGVHPSKLTYQTWAMDVARKVHANEEINVRLQKGSTSKAGRNGWPQQ